MDRKKREENKSDKRRKIKMPEKVE